MLTLQVGPREIVLAQLRHGHQTSEANDESLNHPQSLLASGLLQEMSRWPYRWQQDVSASQNAFDEASSESSPFREFN